MNKISWLELMERNGLVSNLDTFDKLLSNYNQTHRYYHNIHHINAVLVHLNLTKELANDYNAIEIALWFHDAIYKIFSSSNELDSANWAVAFLNQNGINTGFSDKVHSLIMATLHNAIPIDSDENLMVDIDLTILGSAPETYQLFESLIRKEYKLIPSFIYKKKRKEILSQFLERERVYSHDYFYDQLELTARSNITKAIQNL